MKTIQVSAAIICRHKQILATQRGYGAFSGMWEFPGGKVEAGESPQEALLREIKEELAIEINIGELFGHIEYDYPQFHLSLDCFLCEMASEKFTLNEHQDAKWLNKETIDQVEWLPADLDIIKRLKESIL